jgi:hypothetical protein
LRNDIVCEEIEGGEGVDASDSGGVGGDNREAKSTGSDVMECINVDALLTGSTTVASILQSHVLCHQPNPDELDPTCCIIKRVDDLHAF